MDSACRSRGPRRAGWLPRLEVSDRGNAAPNRPLITERCAPTNAQVLLAEAQHKPPSSEDRWKCAARAGAGP